MVWRTRQPDNPWEDEADGKGEHQVQMGGKMRSPIARQRERSISSRKTND